jgi:Helix-turn-helix domain
MERKGLWITPEIMGDQRLTHTEKILFAEITNLAQLGECFAGNQYFSEFLQCHEKHVSRLLKKLVKLELITLTLIYKEGSKEIEKRILTPSNMEVTTPPHECYYPSNIEVTTPSNIDVTDKKQVFKKQIKKQINNKTYISEFAELWALYPNKKGRPQAEQAYIRARKANVEYETIKNGLESYIKYVKTQHTEKRFIKHGSTWFNQKAWADEYELHGQRPKGIFGLVYDEYNQGEDYFEQDRGNKGFGSFEELLPEPIEIIGRGQYSQYDSANVGKQF